MLAPKSLKLCNHIKHTPYFKTCLNDFKKWLFITNHFKSKNPSVVKKVLLGVPNEAVLLRITKVHLNITALCSSRLFPTVSFFDTPCRVHWWTLGKPQSSSRIVCCLAGARQQLGPESRTDLQKQLDRTPPIVLKKGLMPARKEPWERGYN